MLGLLSSLGRDRDMVIDSLTILGVIETCPFLSGLTSASTRLSGAATLTTVSSTRGSETSASSSLSAGT